MCGGARGVPNRHLAAVPAARLEGEERRVRVRQLTPVAIGERGLGADLAAIARGAIQPETSSGWPGGVARRKRTSSWQVMARMPAATTALAMASPSTVLTRPPCTTPLRPSQYWSGTHEAETRRSAAVVKQSLSPRGLSGPQAKQAGCGRASSFLTSGDANGDSWTDAFRRRSRGGEPLL